MKIRKFNESIDLQSETQELFDSCKDYLADLIDDESVEIELAIPVGADVRNGVMIYFDNFSEWDAASYRGYNDRMITLESNIINHKKRVTLLEDLNSKINFLVEEYKNKGYDLEVDYDLGDDGMSDTVYLELKNS